MLSLEEAEMLRPELSMMSMTSWKRAMDTGLDLISCCVFSHWPVAGMAYGVAGCSSTLVNRRFRNFAARLNMMDEVLTVES